MINIFYLIVVLIIPNAFSAIKTQSIEYQYENTVMEGYIAYDDSAKTPLPGILIVHDWMGLGTFSKEKAEKLAQDGHFAFAVDVYGKNIRPKDNEEASKLAAIYKGDRKLLRARLSAAFDKLVSMKEVNPKKILVMGYCFGGTAALELARSGAPLAGTAVFHGGLGTPTPEDAKNIKGPILVMHGADDPNVPPKEVAAFKEEMKNAHVPLQFVAYKGAVHSFTNPAAGNDNSKGNAYNAEADKKSWLEFQKFMKKVFK